MSWIKIRTDLRNHPKVVRLASALKTDRLRTLGALQVVWSAFDTHSADGLLEGYALDTIDEDTFPGFGAALQQVRWIEVVEGGLRLPEFDTHNGASAKKRAQDTKLKQSNRGADKQANGSWTPAGQMSAEQPDKLSGSEADKSRTREELDKKKNPHKPPRGNVHGFPPGFDAFWSAYPKKVAKEAAAKAFARLAPDERLLPALMAALETQAASEAWTKEGAKYAPNAASWLNGKRWEDETPGVGDSPFAGAL